MRRLSRDPLIALGFGVAAFVLAFIQRPGLATSDTKIDLHVDPAAFVAKVASIWNPSLDFGAVQSVQYSGYLWPTGPFFAALNELGLPSWVVHRIWLGTVFALSAWGVLRLLDVIVGRPRGVAHVVAAAFYVLNPYTAVFTGRTSIVFAGYAALPWLLLVVYHGVRAVRGLRGWRGWWWAAAFALILTSLGGGINAAVVGWMLVGPLLLLLYEPATGAVRWRDSANFLARVGLLGILASLWWIVPLLLGSRYGIDFLQFTEKPFSIWGANSAPEALRLMAYWTSYIGTGFHGANLPFFTDSRTLLFNPLVVGASLVLPALAVAGLLWSRRWRYAPFLLVVLLVGTVIEMAGFPNGTPIRSGMEFLYREVLVLRFMRTTQKAAPLVALGTAGLLGLGARYAWLRLQGLRGTGRRVALVAAPMGLAALIAFAALPLVRGTAVEKQLTWEEIPSAWTQTADGLDRELPRNTRALVLPGQIFAYYSWGGTVDAILPRLTKRPVAVRYETPYSDAHAHDLLFTLDRLVSQGRLVPGQLAPLLRLTGVGAVVTGTDDDIARSGAVHPAKAARVLAGQGLDRPDRAYGPSRPVPPPRGELGPTVPLPQVRRYDVAGARGLVHVAPRGPATVVDGAAEGLANLAAFGALPERRPTLYAADLSRDALQRQAAQGADVVVTDSNRRRRFLPEFGEQNLGATLRESDPIDANWATIEPFPERGTDAQTVAALQGARYLRAPNQGGLLEFPERAPFAAFDGDPSTLWAADRYLPPRDRYIEIGLDRPRDVPYVDLLPVRDPYGVETEVAVNGVRAKLGPGTTRVRIDQRDVSSVRVQITKLVQPRGNLRGSGGFREISIPGVEVRQRLRTPLVAGRALAGRDLRRSSLTYLFERTRADDPTRANRRVGSPLLELPENREDAERTIDRATFAPASRAYAVDAWVQPAPSAPDSGLDRLVGLRSELSFDSSDRFDNGAANRASSAFDADPGTAWIGTWAPPSASAPWVEWRGPRALSVTRMRLEPARQAVRRPTRVRVSWATGTTPPLPVGPEGTVVLPRPVQAAGFRVTILDAAFAPGTPSRARAVRAVGIGSLRVAGLAPVAPPTSGPLRTSCGSVRASVDGRSVALQPRGTVADLLAGRPLRAAGCRGDVAMDAGIRTVRSERGPFSVDLLRLRSPATQPPAVPAGGGRVLDPGQLRNASVDGARVDLDGPSWLVLGQSFSRGWRATCDGRALGEPQVIDGYANGWLAPADCRQVSFTFTPQSGVRVGYLVSGLVCLALLVFLVVGRLRGGPRPALVRPPLLPEERTRPMGLIRAAAVALVASVPLAALFALRTGVVIFPVLTLILWRGIGARPLIAAAAALIGIAVPLAYAISSPQDRGGFNFEYSLETIAGHWITVAALVLLMVAAWRMLATVRAQRHRPEPPPSAMPPDPELQPQPRELELVGARRAPDSG